MKTILSFLYLSLLFYSASASPTEKPVVILFMIDGLHWQAPEKLDMPVFNALKKEGTFIEKSYMIIPYHPTIGDYSEFNSCSFPNPMLHEGTIFIERGNKMIQEVISPDLKTAFIVNTTAYRSVSRGFTISIMDDNLSDDEVVGSATEILDNHDISFMRIHLQTPGSMGTTVAMRSEGKSYDKNIWGEGSPYIEAVQNADRLLGQFIRFLKDTDKWNNTILIVTSDHGQSNVGWHPMMDEDSWMTPLLFAGKGIAKNRKLDYFEHTDLAPTIAWLLGKEMPGNNGGAGRPVRAVAENTAPADYTSQMNIKTLNEQIKSFNLLRAQMIIGSEHDNNLANIISALENENLTPEPFYHQDRITEWSAAGTIDQLIQANERIIEKMKRILRQEDNQ